MLSEVKMNDRNTYNKLLPIQNVIKYLENHFDKRLIMDPIQYKQKNSILTYISTIHYYPFHELNFCF